MAARGSQVLQFVPSEVYQSATPPDSPAVGKLWRNTGVTPNELLAWTGKGASSARSYAGVGSGVSVSFEDLSDDRKLGVTVKTIAAQAGTGTPSPSNVRAIVGKPNVTIKQPQKNLLDPTIAGLTRSGVTLTYDAASQTITLNGTCTADNTIFLFTVQRSAIAGAHALSIHFVSGTRTLSGSSNCVQIAEAGWVNIKVLQFPSEGVVQTFALTPREYENFTVRTDAGSVFTNYKFRIQIEYGTTATSWELYNAKSITLTPMAPLCGLPGYEDEIGNDGHEIHKTSLITLLGMESWAYDSVDPATQPAIARFNLSIIGVAASPSGICSHFPFTALGDRNTTTETASGHGSGNILTIFILKSRMAGWLDAWTNAQKETAFKAWLVGKNVQVLYRLATPTTATVTPVRINGTDGVNTVASDGASVGVTYIASGWAALGAVQRMAIESVSISPEEGLRVDTVLSSADGAHQVPTFFNARGARYGLFRSSDGMMILGGMVLPNGQPAGVAGALVSPGATGETRIEIETESEGSGQARVDTAALHLVQPSFAGATGSNPGPTGEKTPVRIEAVRNTLLNGQSQYVDNYSVSLKALNAMRLVALSESGSEQACLLVQRASEGSTIYTDGAYSASDRARTLSNFAPMIHMSMPTGESIVYNATARRYMPDWKTIEDDYGRYGTFKGGNQSLRDVGVVIQMSGYYRFVFHDDLEQASSSSGAMLHINRMPADWTPPATRDYCTDADLTPARIAYRRAASAPLNASVTTCGLVADLWCFSGEKILPVVSMAAASKALVSAGTFFTAQKIG